MNTQGQEMQQTQSLRIAPQLRQSLKILQVPALELRNTILDELQSNPVLEELAMGDVSIEQESSEEERGMDESQEMDFKEEYDILQKLDEDWREHFSAQETTSPFTQDDAARRQHFIDSIVIEKSLQEHLMEQAKLSECNADQLKAMQYLIGSLDDRGFLAMKLSEVAKMVKLPEKVIKSTHEILKTFDPVGIGSKDVQECLLQALEADAEGVKDASLAAKIVRNHYTLLLRRRIPDIAKKLSVGVDEVQEALELISSLDPAPGRSFKEDSNRSVTPDVTVEKEGNKWVVTLNNDYIPRLRLSKAYKELMAKGVLSAKEKEYIRDKIRSAKFLINAIEQRQKTLERIAREILKFQQDFFEEGITKLHPLTMHQVGEVLELHETTVSRAIANKYIETPYGLYELKYFFTFGFKAQDGSEVSNTSIKEAIARLIEAEFPEEPYSDQKIVKLLEEKDIKIARRTVAKYREELGILSTSLRRKYTQNT